MIRTSVPVNPRAISNKIDEVMTRTNQRRGWAAALALVQTVCIAIALFNLLHHLSPPINLLVVAVMLYSVTFTLPCLTGFWLYPLRHPRYPRVWHELLEELVVRGVEHGYLFDRRYLLHYTELWSFQQPMRSMHVYRTPLGYTYMACDLSNGEFSYESGLSAAQAVQHLRDRLLT